jgi:hypothetical protein
VFSHQPEIIFHVPRRGLMFISAIVLFFSAILGGVLYANIYGASPDPDAAIVLSIMLGILTLVLLWIITYRRTWKILLSEKKAISSHSAFFFLGWTQKPVDIAKATQVRLDSESRSSGKSSYTVYPVRLAGVVDELWGRDGYEIYAPRIYFDARQFAELLAKNLNFAAKKRSNILFLHVMKTNPTMLWQKYRYFIT